VTRWLADEYQSSSPDEESRRIQINNNLEPTDTPGHGGPLARLVSAGVDRCMMAAAGSAREQLRHQEPSLGRPLGVLSVGCPFFPPRSVRQMRYVGLQALVMPSGIPLLHYSSVPPSGSLFVLSSELHLSRFPSSSHSLPTVFRSVPSPRHSLSLRRHIISRRHLSTARIYDNRDNLSDRPHDPPEPINERQPG
jgi:hypothetical protein